MVSPVRVDQHAFGAIPTLANDQLRVLIRHGPSHGEDEHPAVRIDDLQAMMAIANVRATSQRR